MWLSFIKTMDMVMPYFWQICSIFFLNSNNHGVSWFVVQQQLTTNNGFENAALKKQSWFHFSPGHGSSKCRNFSVGTAIQQKCILVLGTEQFLVLNKILFWFEYKMYFCFEQEMYFRRRNEIPGRGFRILEMQLVDLI